MTQNPHNADTGNRAKRRGFRAAAVGLVLLSVAAAELLIRLTPVGRQNLELIDIGPINFLTRFKQGNETWCRVTHRRGYAERNTVFPARKPANTIRVFCVGGSASAGYPHPPEEIYSVYLQEMLQTAYPERSVEVINCGAHGFAAYRVKRVLELLLDFQPDAFVIWSGNNEFLESRRYRASWLEDLTERVGRHSRLVQVLRRRILPPPRLADAQDDTPAFWKKVQGEALDLRSDPVQFQKVKEHYRASIESMVSKAGQAGVRVVLLTVPVNLRDWQPNVSFNRLHGAARERWQRTYDAARRALLERDASRAVALFKEALSMEPEHADSSFWMARACEQVHDADAAWRHYVAARDQDCNPFRAISDFNDSVRRIAAAHPSIILVDAEAALRASAQGGVPGFDLFLDHVHPTKQGNVRIARQVANALLARRCFGESHVVSFSDADADALCASPYREEGDTQILIHQFSICCITHQYASAIALGRYLLAITPEATRTEPANRSRTARLNDAIDAFTLRLKADEQRIRQGSADQQLETEAEKRLNKFYATYFPYGTY